MNRNTIYILIAIIALLGGYVLYKGGYLFGKPKIVSAAVSRTIDAQGNATETASLFDSTKDRIVYVVLSLKNVTKKTKISYVRYLNGGYIDSKVATPSASGVNTFYFTFEKGIGGYPAGNYKVALYLDGKHATDVAYTFK